MEFKGTNAGQLAGGCAGPVSTVAEAARPLFAGRVVRRGASSPRPAVEQEDKREDSRARGLRPGTGWPCGAGRRAAQAQPTPDTRQVGYAPPGPRPWKTPRAPGNSRLGEGGPRAPRGRGSEHGAGRGPLSACLGAHTGQSEQVEEPLGGTSGSDSLALSMLMRVQWLLSICWIPSGWGGGLP